MKFFWLLVLAVVLWRLLLGRWPWQPSVKTLRENARARARSLLGVGPNATRQDVVDAHRRLVVAVHPDRGGSNEKVHEANAARDVLLGETTIPAQEQT